MNSVCSLSGLELFFVDSDRCQTTIQLIVDEFDRANLITQAASCGVIGIVLVVRDVLQTGAHSSQPLVHVRQHPSMGQPPSKKCIQHSHIIETKPCKRCLHRLVPHGRIAESDETEQLFEIRLELLVNEIDGFCGRWQHQRHPVTKTILSAARPTSTSSPTVEGV